MRTRTCAIAVALLAALADAADTPLRLEGYVKTHAVRLESELPKSMPGETSLWSVSDRLRLKLTGRLPGDASLHLAYELAPRLQDTALAGDGVSGLVLDPNAYRLADFDTQLWPNAPETAGSFSLHHSLDRLHVILALPHADIVVGRQAIAWGSAIVINPTDVVAPYTFDALDREERYGVDAIRVRIPSGDLSETDIGYIPGRDFDVRHAAFFARHKLYAYGTDIALLALGFRRHLLLGLDVTRAVGNAQLRLEAAYTRPGFFERSPTTTGADYCRVSVDLDTFLTPELYGFIGYHLNSAGTSEPDRYTQVRQEVAFRDGATYLVGRHYLNAGFTIQLTPLISAGMTAVWNVRDHSAALSPLLEYNVAEDVYISAGGTIGVGPGPRLNGDGSLSHRSEFGSAADMGYLSVRFYF